MVSVQAEVWFYLMQSASKTNWNLCKNNQYLLLCSFLDKQGIFPCADYDYLLRKVTLSFTSQILSCNKEMHSFPEWMNECKMTDEKETKICTTLKIHHV